jgi:hypothetical protein
LSKSDLWQVLEEYPEARAMLIERGKQILAKDGLLDEEGLRKAQSADLALNVRCERLQLTVDRLSGSMARLLAEYSVAQRQLKRRLTSLESKLRHSSSGVEAGNTSKSLLCTAVSLDLPSQSMPIDSNSAHCSLQISSNEAVLRRTYSEQ